jgi:hypothetical protein
MMNENESSSPTSWNRGSEETLEASPEMSLEVSLERLLATSAGPERDLLLGALTPHERTAVSKMLEIDDLVWEATHGAPPLQADPVAAMLGLVPDASFRLDSTAFTQQCSRRRVKPTALAARLKARGWVVEASDVFRWQTSVASDVSPALIRVIGDELGVSPDDLIAPPATQPAVLDTVAERVTATKRFADLVQRFALVQRISPSMAHTMLRTRMLATVQRGSEPAVEQMLESLDVLVRALESE